MATIAYLGTTEDSANRTTYTFTGFNFGTASSDRRIIITAVSRDTDAATVSSATIGGVSATIAVQAAGSDGSVKSQAILIAAVPTGTTGDVVITYTTQMSDCIIHGYETTGITTNTATDTASGGTTTIDCIKGGIVIGLATAGSAVTWSGIVEDAESFYLSSVYVSVASELFSETQIDLSIAPSSGTLVAASFPATTPFTNPGNAYASDNSYATLAATSGVLTVEISGDGGETYGSALTKTFGASDTVETYGNGSTELWGLSLTRANMIDSNFRVRVSHGIYSQVYKTFGFTTGTDILTGIEIRIEGKYASSTISIDEIEVKIYYGTSILPVQAGSMAYASNGRKAGEGVGAGTGVLVFYDGNTWIASDTGATVDD